MPGTTRGVGGDRPEVVAEEDPAGGLLPGIRVGELALVAVRLPGWRKSRAGLGGGDPRGDGHAPRHEEGRWIG